MSIFLTVGQVAQELDVSPKTIRYYETIGLLPAVDRSTNGYRRFRPADVNRLTFIIRAKTLGLTLKEIRMLVSAAEQGECHRITKELKEIVESKICECNQRIESLTEFRANLEDLSDKIDADQHHDHGNDTASHSPFSPSCTCLPKSA